MKKISVKERAAAAGSFALMDNKIPILNIVWKPPLLPSRGGQEASGLHWSQSATTALCQQGNILLLQGMLSSWGFFVFHVKLCAQMQFKSDNKRISAQFSYVVPEDEIFSSSPVYFL